MAEVRGSGLGNVTVSSAYKKFIISSIKKVEYLKANINDIMKETVLMQCMIVGTYQVSLSGGADLHLMSFLLDVLNQVIQHVGLGEILKPKI